MPLDCWMLSTRTAFSRALALLCCTALLVAVVIPNQALAAVDIEVVSQTTGGTVGVSIHGNAWQSFNVPREGPLGIVQFKLRRLYTTFTATVYVRNGEGSGGSLIAYKSVSVPGAENNDPYKWISFPFTGVTLLPGRTYSLVLTCNSCGAIYSGSDPYKGGRSGRYSTIDRYDDYAFRVFFSYPSCSDVLYTHPSTGACEYLTECSPGNYASTLPTASSDRSCSMCSEGTFTSEKNEAECTAFTQCRGTEYQTKAPTITSDRECEDITTCVVGTNYETTQATFTSNAICTPTRTCTSSQYETVEPTYTTNRECMGLTMCVLEETYETVEPTDTSDRECGDVTVCNAGEEELIEPTLTRDRDCRTCRTGYFKAFAGPGDCVECDGECDANEYITIECTKTSDTVCEACTGSCDDGFYESGSCTDEGVKICERCLVEEDCEYHTYLHGVCNPSSLNGPSCRLCFETCGDCTGPHETQCIDCIEDYSLHEDGSCVSDCGPNFFTKDSVCTRCHSSCFSECESETREGCVTCQHKEFGYLGDDITYLLPVGGPGVGECVSECPEGTYRDDSTGFCQTCTQCDAGSFIVTPCLPANDTVCETCSHGHTFHPHGNETECFDVSDCPIGQEVFEVPTLSTDRVCKDCGVNTYQDEAAKLECKPVSFCTSGTYASGLYTTTSDTVCSNLTICNSTSWESVAPTYTTDRRCSLIRDCPPGTLISTAATQTTDNVCSACPLLSYQPLANQDQCNSLTECDFTYEYETIAYTPTTDVVCGNLTVCNTLAGEWERVAATPTTDRECTDDVQFCASYTPDTDNELCDRCFSGYYLQDGGATCTICPMGNACDGVGIEACAKGHFQDTDGQSECLRCPPGSFSNEEGSYYCDTCDGNMFQRNYGQTSCQQMQTGYKGYFNDTLASRYQSFQVGFSEEEICDAGHFCELGVQRFCTAGTHSQEGSDDCIPCGPAGYSTRDRSTSCIVTPRGWYGEIPTVGDRNVITSIAQCPRGSFCINGVKSLCPAGTFQSLESQSTCQQCGSGKYLADEGATSASDCTTIPSGYYGVGGTPTTRTGISICELGHRCTDGVRTECDSGTFQNRPGQSACQACDLSCPNGLLVNREDPCDSISGISRCLDQTPPAIALASGSETVEVEYGSLPRQPNIICLDTRDGSLNVVASAEVDSTSFRDQVIVYSCEDSAGLSASLSITYMIVDTTPPTLTLNGDEVMYVIQFDPFDDPGANATDIADRSPTVTMTGSVNIRVVGDYEIEYSATDRSGNTADPVVRTVRVLDVDVEIAAQTSANMAYAEALDEGADTRTAERAARRAYALADGERPLDLVVAEAQAAYAASSTGSSASLSLPIVIAIIAGVILLVVILAVLLLTRRKSYKNDPYYAARVNNPMFVHHPDYEETSEMVNTRDIMKQFRTNNANDGNGNGNAHTGTFRQGPSASHYYSSITENSDSTYAVPDAHEQRQRQRQPEQLPPSSSALYNSIEDSLPPPEYSTEEYGSVKPLPPSLLPQNSQATGPPGTYDVVSDLSKPRYNLARVGSDGYVQPALSISEKSRADVAAKNDAYLSSQSRPGPTNKGRRRSSTTNDDDDDDNGVDRYSSLSSEQRALSLTSRNAYADLRQGQFEIYGTEDSEVGEGMSSQVGSIQTVVQSTMSIWFQPLLDRSGAQRYVGSLPVGSFVVRKSSQEGNYALTVNSSEGKVWNGLIKSGDDGYTINDKPQLFDTIAELIAFCATDAGSQSLSLPTTLLLPNDDC